MLLKLIITPTVITYKLPDLKKTKHKTNRGSKWIVDLLDVMNRRQTKGDVI